LVVLNTGKSSKRIWRDGRSLQNSVRLIKTCVVLWIRDARITWGWWLLRPSDKTINWGPVCVRIQNIKHAL
jgi:hypothetical protein